ncbi:uncharacterized protein isoform X19 [Macaca fascicularis]|uniref:uncharacterized protein isoform X19 n=1 Tax=Macaca fascicularis TaxID=9541 RepID=UPI003D157CFC
MLKTSTRKLSRQLWPNTKSGRWRCLCLPNAGPWSCRPPWMPTPLQQAHASSLTLLMCSSGPGLEPHCSISVAFASYLLGNAR